jgi:hypothetical protein
MILAKHHASSRFALSGHRAAAIVLDRGNVP